MARRKKSEGVDLTQAYELTAGLIDALACPEGKSQAFLRDTKAPGLRVRVTTAGAKTFVFEGKLRRQTIRRSIGDVRAWSIEDARKEANALRVRLDSDEDPRATDRAKLEQQQIAEAERIRELEQEAARAVTVGDLWPEYLRTGKPKRKDAWKPRYVEDLKKMSAAGGEPKKRGQGLTRPGPLAPLMNLALPSITEDVLAAWMEQEASRSKHQAARALMMFRGFLRWCAMKPHLRGLADLNAGRAPTLQENFPALKRRNDVLMAAQTKGWWAEAEKLSNRTASIYLRALLLTGARREELAGLKWQDVDFQWNRLTLADKIHATRTIPLTPFLGQLLATLPRINEFVFASTGKKGRIVDARAAHQKVLQGAGIDHLTLHGLRRANKQRGRAAVPHGAVDQMQGHAPSGTADGYAVLPLDDLRPFAERIEAHILELAGVQFDTTCEPGKLKLIATT